MNILLVNKKHKLDPNYVPENLVIVEDGIISSITNDLPMVTKTVKNAFDNLKKEALDNNYKIFLNSGYRSYQIQKELIIDFLNNMSFDEVLERVAAPGTSEHQTGLAVDFVIQDKIDDTGIHYVKGFDMWNNEGVKWVFENAHKHGFILRYPKDKENITNQKAEPWHLRYVGIKHATVIKELNITLEEYLEEQSVEIIDNTKYIPLIGVIGRVIHDENGNPVISTGEYYRKALSRNHAAVVTLQPPQDILYNNLSPKEVERLTEEDKRLINRTLKELDGIVAPGGSKWYEYDEYVIKYALDHKIPLLGICLGMQTIAYVDNKEKFAPKFKTYFNDTEIDHQQIGPEYVHPVNLKSDSHFYNLIKQDTIMVNSRHNFNIGGITNNLKVTGYSPDGIPEYGEIDDFVIATQWHPELMAEYDNNNQALIKYFVELTRKK